MKKSAWSRKLPNAKDLKEIPKQNILLVGPTGSGKTTQIWTLPGKKFVYIFDPNSIASLKGCDCDYEEFLPDILELDSTLKGFNKGSRDDQPASKRVPTAYMDWGNHLNTKTEEGFFEQYDWICFDSITLLQKMAFDRQLFINNRYGKVEDLSDYRVVGSKLSDIFRSISALKNNIYITGHIREFQDETTKKISTELNMSGSARSNIPIVMTNIWLAQSASTEKEIKYQIQTRPAQRGLQSIRSSIQGLEMFEDVTIKDFNCAEDYGIGALLRRA